MTEVVKENRQAHGLPDAGGVSLVELQGGEDPVFLTTNEPTLNYYLRPDFYRTGDPGILGQYSILEWEVGDAGGGKAYMRAWLAEARRQDRSLFVLITEPELREKDRDGSIAAFLRDHLHQVASFPNWVGPKDQSILIYR